MDEETLWVLKKLSAGEISAQSADRILRALALLRREENSRFTPKSDIEPAQGSEDLQEAPLESLKEFPDETAAAEIAKDETPVAEAADDQGEEDSSEVIAVDSKSQDTTIPDEVGLHGEEEEYEPVKEEYEDEGFQDPDDFSLEGTIWAEDADGIPLLGDDGTGVIENIPEGMELVLEKAGDVMIQGWDQPYIRAEGKVNSSTVIRTERNLKIGSENGIILYMPEAVKDIVIASGSGSIDVKGYPNNLTIDSDTGEINISETKGKLDISSIEGDISLKNCCGDISLESELGKIEIFGKCAEGQQGNDLMKRETKDMAMVSDIKIGSGSGDVFIAGISGNMNVHTNSGDIKLEKCRGQSIALESIGGNLIIKDTADNIELRNQNGSIVADGFSGKIRIKSWDTEVFLSNSGDAEIHIESDGGNIEIEDCYADVYVDSGIGDVSISGKNLSFSGMGKIDMRMGAGQAYLNRRTFENIRIVIEEGNAEVNMEKLVSGGTAQISVYKGSVTAMVPAKFGCDLTAHCPRKNMHIELPIEIIEKEKSRLRGILNGGGPRVEVIAPNGEIRFRAQEPPREQKKPGSAVINL